MSTAEFAPYAPVLEILTVDLDDKPTSITAFKKALSSGRNILQERFRAGSSPRKLTRGYARFIDEVLILAWQPELAPHTKEATLLAVGGYGRNELFPCSDIDLMVLTRDSLSATAKEKIQKFLTFLWDIGLEVGHSVRTVKETVTEAKNDITVITNLLEARPLKGSSVLYDRIRRATANKRLWPSKKFYAAKIQEQEKRHKKYEGTAYKLEPNIKESPGGLRDIHTIGWIAKRHFETRKITILKDSGFLTEEEFKTLQEGREYLSKIRISLHLLTDRGEDRLLFDFQRTLAKQFGYEGRGNEPIEQFMQKYYRTVMELGRLSEMLIQHFDEAVLPQAFWRPRRITQLNRRFQVHYGYLEVINEDIFRRYPQALLEVFLLLQQHPELKGVRASTIRLIRHYRHQIDDVSRDDSRTKSYFLEILRQPCGITRELRRMNRYGILAAYLPEFENIVGRMQYDLFHTYTVDEHTLFVIRNLRRFTVPEHHHEFPLCNQIMATLPKPEIIYIAGLYHDIAKGRGGDHSSLGAVDARAFCERHNLSGYDTDLICWLVENHLSMSSTSQKQDISDPDVIEKFARHIADNTRLNYLYVLTVADICATNPSLWNNWKANLLSDLYHACRNMYRHGLGSKELEKLSIESRRKEASDHLLKSGIISTQLQTLWDRMPREYFLRHSADTIVWHSTTILGCSDSTPPIVSCRYDAQRGVNNVFIYTSDQISLFAHCASALSQLQLNILDARILETNDSYVLDTFVVLNEQGKPISNPADLDIIENRVLEEIQLGNAPVRQRMVTIPRALKQFTLRTSVTFEQDKRLQRTLLRLRTTDRPGILAGIGQVFMEHNVRLYNARVATFGERVEDVFYITTQDKRSITDELQLENLKMAIIDTLSVHNDLPE